MYFMFKKRRRAQLCRVDVELILKENKLKNDDFIHI